MIHFSLILQNTNVIGLTFRAILGKTATPKIKSWADIVKKPAVAEKQAPVAVKTSTAVKPPTPRPSTKV